jgi:hypothetical protein
MKRYKELKFNDKIYTEPYKIDEILVKNKFEWFLDCEVENVRIEITKDTLVFNSGVFFNGTWVYGVFRDGQWKYGTWEGGVWYNGTFYNGIFKNGLIFNGRFINGKIEGGEIRGGEFFDVQIGHEVVKNISKENKNSPKPQQGQPQNRGTEEKIQGQVQPKVQPEKIEERYIKTYEKFFSKVSKFFEITGEDDDFGRKLLDYIHNHDIEIEKKKYANDYQFFIKKTGNDADPLGEEVWDEDILVKVEKYYYGGYADGDSGGEETQVSINEEALKLGSIRHKIYRSTKLKYEENQRRDKNVRLNKYSDLMK